MGTNTTPNTLDKYSQCIQPKPVAPNVYLPFMDRPELQQLMDILSRQFCHHAILRSHFSPTIYSIFFDAVAQTTLQANLRPDIKRARIIHLNIKSIKPDEIDSLIQCTLALTEPHLIFLAHEQYLPIANAFSSLLNHSPCRFVLYTYSSTSVIDKHDQLSFQLLDLAPITQKEMLAALKIYRNTLETFHRITIPDDLLPDTLHLAERYLSSSQALDKALHLLDSAAARAANSQQDNAIRPALHASVIANTLSTWSSIPASHLSLHAFNAEQFTANLQQRIFGQDIGLGMIGQALQQAESERKQKQGPFCSLLFVGEDHTGKKSVALALVEQLFKRLDALHVVLPFKHNIATLADIKCQRSYDNRMLSLGDIMRDRPYSVIYFDKVDELAPPLMENLLQLLTTGHLQDTTGDDICFTQSTIILTTALGSQRLSELASQFNLSSSRRPVDLIQLIMSSKKSAPRPEEQQFTPDELVKEILPAITATLPKQLCELLHIIPFMPLDKSAISKIIYLKLKILGKQLEAHYNVTLTYAAEVIHHLADKVTAASLANAQTLDIEKMLTQLHFCVEHAIFNQVKGSEQLNQLVLQLNETGQLLRCDWVQAGATDDKDKVSEAVY